MLNELSRLLCVIELRKRDENGGTPRTCTPCRFAGGTIPLATGPGALGRLTFHWSSRQESHPQLSRLKRDASADWATGGKEKASPEGIAPSTRRLEAGCSSAELRRREVADSGGLAPHARAAGTIRFQNGPGALVPLGSHGVEWRRPVVPPHNRGVNRDPSGFQPAADASPL